MALTPTYRLHVHQFVARPLDEVFPFFETPENLEAITPPWLGFRIITPRPIPMRAGTLIDYRISLRGVPMRWRTFISRHEPPNLFVDEQLRGPYALWRHEHRFEPADATPSTPAGVWIRDTVDYRLRFFLGLDRVAHALLVKPDLTRIFEYRRQAVARLLGDAAGVPQPPIRFEELDDRPQTGALPQAQPRITRHAPRRAPHAAIPGRSA